jgi:glycosyltransferase involved in cell wall biosynthesis
VIVAHVGSIDGGAGAAALNIHRAMRDDGVSSRFLAMDPARRPPEADVLQFPRRVAGRNSPRALLFRAALKIYTTGRPAGAGLFSYTGLPIDSPFPFDLVRPDLIHLHWIAQGIDYRSFFRSIPPGLPVVWTLHDTEPFTGGCHATGGCVRYRRGCGSCPQLNALRNAVDLSAITIRRKRRLYRGLNLTMVAIGEANAGQAKRASVLAGTHGVTVIPIGIDVTRFTPRSRAESRAALGIQQDRLVIAFGAIDLGNVYKGFNVLLDALSRLRNRDRILLLLFGGPLPADVSLPAGGWLHAGFEQDARRLSSIYAAADVFVLPSLSEALGQVGLEALACGTPVVGSRVGGIPDYVIEGKTGRLVEPGNAGELAATLDWMIEHPEERRDYGAAGPALIRERFSVAAVTRSYRTLYERLTAGG